MSPNSMFDAHFHIWTPSVQPWLSDAASTPTPPGHMDKAPLARDYLFPDYLSTVKAAGANVRKAVYVQAGWHVKGADPVGETEWVTRQTENNPEGVSVGILGHVDLDQPEKAADQLRRHMQFPMFRGVRFMLDYHPTLEGLRQTARGDWMQDPAFHQGMQLLQEHQLVFDMQLNQIQLSEGADLARKFPGVKFVLNHTGFPLSGARDAGLLSEWRQGMAQLSSVPNVYVKIGALGCYDEALGHGGWSVETMRPYVHETLSLFGAGRCMWSTNLPVDTLAGDFPARHAALIDCIAHLGPEEREQFLCKTAEHVYRL